MCKYFFDALDVFEKTSSPHEVFQYVEGIENQGERESTFKKLAKFFASQGRIHEVKKFLTGIHDEMVLTNCLCEVARELRRRGHTEHGKVFFQDSLERAIQLKADTIKKANLFLVLSSELHDAGRREEAVALLRRTVELVTQGSGRLISSKFLLGCSGQLARWNYPEEARKVAEGISEEWLRRRALHQLNWRPVAKRIRLQSGLGSLAVVGCFTA